MHNLSEQNSDVEVERDSYNFNLITKYFDHIVEVNQLDGIIVNDQTAVDLDLDNVFVRIDKTTSRIGQQYLYAKIRNIHSEERVKRFDDFVEHFSCDHQLRNRCKKNLSKLTTYNNYYVEDLFYSLPKKIKRINVIYGLSLSFILSVIFSFVFNPIFAIFALVVFIVNCYIHYKNKFTLIYYLDVIRELSKCVKVIQLLKKEKEIVANFDDLSFIDKIAKIDKKVSFVGRTNNSSSEIIEAILSLLELIKIAINAEVIIFSSFIDDIIGGRDDIHRVFKFIGEIDAAISVSILREEMNPCCKPQFLNTKEIEAEKITHPLIYDCVPNSIVLHEKSLLLTGSNMAGKTTFLRTIGLNIILGETIFTCFAEKLCVPFTHVLSSIRIADDISNGTSYFLEEVLVIKSFIETSRENKSCLFILDEVFKGTNTIERISAAKALLSYLNRTQNIVLVSTHDIELTELLTKENYDLYHFREEIRDKKLLFDYKLHKGRLTTRNALEILKLYGYPEEIIKDALTTQDQLLHF